MWPVSKNLGCLFRGVLVQGIVALFGVGIIPLPLPPVMLGNAHARGFEGRRLLRWL